MNWHVTGRFANTASRWTALRGTPVYIASKTFAVEIPVDAKGEAHAGGVVLHELLKNQLPGREMVLEDALRVDLGEPAVTICGDLRANLRMALAADPAMLFSAAARADGLSQKAVAALVAGAIAGRQAGASLQLARVERDRADVAAGLLRDRLLTADLELGRLVASGDAREHAERIFWPRVLEKTV